MKVLCAAFVCVLASVLPSAAQPIHGNPQKAAYAGPFEWPTISNQCHWMAPSIGPTPGMPAHTHVDMTFPVSAEWTTGLLTVPFKITLFHTNGRAVNVTGSMLKSWTLDNGKTFPLQGDVNGVVIFTGTATFDPALGVASGRTPQHGYYPLFLNTETRYTNGDFMRNSLRLSVFSVIDTTKPEVSAGDGTGIRTQSTCNVFDSTGGNIDRWQSNILQYVQTLPVLGEISPENPWRLQAFGWNYLPPQSQLPPGTLEAFVDPDLHNLVPGTKIDSFTGFRVARSLYLPTGIPDGTHKLMVAWRRPNFAGDKELTSILTFNVTNGQGGPAQPPNNTSLHPESGVAPPPPPPPPPPHD